PRRSSKLSANPTPMTTTTTEVSIHLPCQRNSLLNGQLFNVKAKSERARAGSGQKATGWSKRANLCKVFRHHESRPSPDRCDHGETRVAARGSASGISLTEAEFREGPSGELESGSPA